MKQLAFASCIFSALVPWGAAHAGTEVYPGCAVPTLKTGHHTFFIDPVRGSPKGDGSAAKPWRTLAEVLDSASKLVSTQGRKNPGDALIAMNAAGPIKPGDVLMLMSGNHGAVKIFNAFNADFITVMAAPGQTPIVSQFSSGSAAKWMFQGIKFQGEDPAKPANLAARSATNLVLVGNGWLGDSSNFVFTDSTFSTADDTSGWTELNWLLKPFNTALYNYADCTSIVGNKFFNVLNGIGTQGAHTLISGNSIVGFANDAIAFQTGDVTISKNKITRSVSPTISPWHPDAMQGLTKFVNGVPQVQRNIVIDSNVVIQEQNAESRSKQSLQGIDNFGSKHWSGVTVQNNIVANNSWHGISFGDVDHLHILNNTILSTNPSVVHNWIQATGSSTGGAAVDVVVRNNTSPQIVINVPGAEVDHNFVGGNFTLNNVIYKKSIAEKNIIVDTSLVSQFIQPDASTSGFDARLRRNSPLIGSGSPVLAPSQDVVGVKRTTPETPGAYAAGP